MLPAVTQGRAARLPAARLPAARLPAAVRAKARAARVGRERAATAARLAGVLPAARLPAARLPAGVLPAARLAGVLPAAVAAARGIRVVRERAARAATLRPAAAAARPRAVRAARAAARAIRPWAFQRPTAKDVYDAAALEVPGGVAVIWGSWPQEYDPEFAIFDTKTKKWGPKKTLAGDAGVSTEHVAITRLADGTLATAWAGDAGLIRIFVNLASDTDSNMTTPVELSGRTPIPDVAIAPFGDGFAVGWVDLQEGSNYDFRARVRIYDAGLTYDRDVDVVLPDGSQISELRFLPTGDRLLVVLTDMPDGEQKTSGYLGNIAADTMDSVTATPIVSHQHAPAAGLAVNGEALEVGSSTPTRVTTPSTRRSISTAIRRVLRSTSTASDGYDQVLRHDADGDRLLWVDPEYSLRYAKLDDGHQPTGEVVVAKKAAQRRPGRAARNRPKAAPHLDRRRAEASTPRRSARSMTARPAPRVRAARRKRAPRFRAPYTRPTTARRRRRDLCRRPCP